MKHSKKHKSTKSLLTKRLVATLGRQMKHSRKAEFLQAFAECGNVSQAADRTGIARVTHYRWLKQDAIYAKEFELARQAAIDCLESEAVRRAVDGWEEPVFYRGEQVGTTRRYSDRLLMFLLKGLAPEKYGTKKVEHSAEFSHRHQHEHFVKQLTKEQLEYLARLGRDDSEG